MLEPRMHHPTRTRGRPVSWARLDDGFPDHPKIEGLSDRAFRAHVTAICYCAANLTDGFVSETAAKRCRIRPQTADKLIAAGLWKRTVNGWQINDYLDYNASRESIMVERERTRNRKAEWRARHAGTNGGTRATGHAGTTNGPSHPIPLKNEVQEDSEKEIDPETSELDHPINGVAHAVDRLVTNLGGDPQTRLKILSSIARGATEADVRYTLEQVERRRPKDRTRYALTVLADRARQTTERITP